MVGGAFNGDVHPVGCNQSVTKSPTKLNTSKITRGHYITNPNNAIIIGKSLKITIHFVLFDSPEI